MKSFKRILLKVLLGIVVIIILVFILIQAGLYNATKSIERNKAYEKLNEQQVSLLLDGVVDGLPLLSDATMTEASGYKIKKDFNLITFGNSETFEANYIPAKATNYYTHQLTWSETLDIISIMKSRGIEIAEQDIISFDYENKEKDLNGQTSTDAMTVTFHKDCMLYVLTGASLGRRNLYSSTDGINPSEYRMSFTATEGDGRATSCIR